MIIAKSKPCWLFVLACVVVIATITLAVYWFQMGSPTTKIAAPPNEVSKGLPLGEVVMKEEEVPIYPGATTDKTGCEYPEVNQCWIWLRTYDPYKQVIAYYREVLVKQGWDIVEDRGSDEARSWGLDLVWTNTEGEVPTQRILSVGAGTNTGENGQPDWTDIHLDWQRLPDPFNIPVYPDNKNMSVNVKERDDTRGNCSGDRTITYETSATVTEVYSYYEQIMPLHGWRLAQINANHSRHFAWDRVFADVKRTLGGFSGIIVLAESSSKSGQPTKVQIDVTASAYMIQCLEQKRIITPSP